MSFSGNQLRAARALLGLDQEALAEKVGVSDNTIRNMEAHGSEPVGGFVSTRYKVRGALEGMGIEFLNDGSPGVRLHENRKAAAASRSAAPKGAARKRIRERKR
jgi:transcriptional regulator with XRE-family HTH domain